MEITIQCTCGKDLDEQSYDHRFGESIIKVTPCPDCRQESADEGYDKGWNKGHSEGYDSGYAAGREAPRGD